MSAHNTLLPVGTHASSHGIPGLDADSYTAHKLKHSTPEHLHLTTRRFFIGPIPEGWLSSNRKSWYKKRLELSSYSSKQQTFHAAEGQSHHPRTYTGFGGPGRNPRLSLSFPQPEDIEDSSAVEESVEETDEDDEAPEARPLEPVSTDVLHAEETEDLPRKDTISPASTWKTAPNGKTPTAEAPDPLQEATTTQVQTDPAQIEDPVRFSYTSSFKQNNLDLPQDNTDANSKTALLPQDSPELRPRSPKKSLAKFDPSPVEPGSTSPVLKRTGTERVRFRVTDAIANRQERVGGKVDRARDRVGRKINRRQTLRAGTIVKMEKMLVRIDLTAQPIPQEFDENGSLKIKTQVSEKWREFMVVARQSKKTDDDDFRLQFWKTRVIPEIDDESSRRKPTHEIKLIPKNTHVNLFSSLDKTVVIWHPYKKGTRIVIMKAGSAAHSAEWYTFLRDALGWKRPSSLQVMVPDLGVTLSIERPFQEVEAAGLDEEDDEAADLKAIEAEQAIAGKIVHQCIQILEGNQEWTEVMHQWHETTRPGLAWKRYDRLEWVHGVNEQKMYGSMAMQQSYDLELRPKVHYPTHVFGKKGVEHDEPAPIEGFLIRLTSQKGLHRRMGKNFFKRLYFSTQDHYLIFNKPAQATPPHPPKLQTIGGKNIPSAHEIVENTPIMYEIEPFATTDGQIKWLHSGIQQRIDQHDREAYEEGRRNQFNLASADGYINLARIKKVRKMQWGADQADESIESGSDVDFHESVANTDREDGTTRQIDDQRTFELVLDNGLVVRLQAYDERTRDEWINRLRKLVKYWKLRKAADMDNFKHVRHLNLQHMKIDEEMEAELGQFGQKWEVNARSEASPHIYHICPISACRTIAMSGLLYHKARRHSTFQRCSVMLTGGKLMIFQSSLRRHSGKQIPHIHQEKQQVIDLKDCYVYSGLIVEDDLLYQNRTFDANHMGVMASLPRVWVEDGWTSSDVDVMCCFVVWMNTRKGWFRTAGSQIVEQEQPTTDSSQSRRSSSTTSKQTGKRAKLKRVRQLGVPGRGMVFKCRSRAERDLWVLNIATEIEKVVERQAWEEDEEGGGVRFAS